MSSMPELFGQDHIDAYLETDGERGHDWIGDTSVLILTTTGRKSGEERMAPLIYGMASERDPMIVASKGGAPEHPAWYRNLQANPEVQVQIHGDKFTARARDANPDERPELWKQMAEIWPAYNDYQQKTDREIPIVILERV